EEPNLLQIEADAIGQNRTYVITMNASGSTENPQIQFSSTPNLTSAQIVRILATGSLEGGGAGAIGLYLGQALMGPGNGEDTLADRLSVKIGQEVTESGSSTVDVVYKLNDLWSVEGEYDRYDTYNLNLVRILLER
ncbi:MAG: translocation/assembly module TamB domain-containing protein, partial [Puniceicoccales bacterium]